MSHSISAASSAIAALGKPKHEPKAGHDLNPAQQARAADPTAKGAAFGALVSSFARAKHAPPPPPPVIETPAETATTIPLEPPVDVVV
jgi:hypothetical protein